MIRSFNALEALEPRRLLAADLIGRSLVVTGTSGDDSIRFSLESGSIVVAFNDDPPQTFNAGLDTVRQIRVFAGAGADITNFAGAFETPITVYGGSGNDRVDGDSLQRFRGYGGDGDDIFRITGIGRDTVYGEAGADLIGTNGGRDYISGDDGNDDLHGGGAADRIFGGEGNDALAGGVSEPFSQPTSDTIEGGAGNDTLRGYQGDDVLIGGPGLDQLGGGDGNDQLFGGEDDDTLDGNDGEDTVRGGPGNDSLRGGRGADAFEQAEVDADEVTDFVIDVDAVL